jgi:LPS export ABC transporter protein LptC
LGAVATFVIVEVVALSPSSVEDPAPPGAAAPADPETLITDRGEKTLASGIPNSRIADYSVDRFRYVSSVGMERQWKIDAERAFLYNAEKLVHARQVTAYLFDPEGKTTVVTGLEAKYFMNQRDLEVFGNVVTKFPDGFELKSEYLRYRPNDRHISIPTSYDVHGDGHETAGQNMRFDSRGLDFEMGKSVIVLPEAVRLTMIRAPKQDVTNAAVPETTVIISDHCVIHRDKQLAHFTMRPERPLDTRFVHITQPDLFARSRRADLRYGDFSQLLQYMIAYEDVLIKETPAPKEDEDDADDSDPDEPPSLRYGTGGRADFDSRQDLIILTRFPQVYQDDDTVTGDIITVHRDTDMVEVEHSNAFSKGD